MTHQLHEFSELRQKDIFCDAVIRTDDGTEFSVHRVILSACSDYFLALFRNNPSNKARNRKNGIHKKAVTFANQNNNNHSYQITGIRGPAMALALDYIYDAKCAIDADNMLELLVVGDYLGVLGLVTFCEDFVISATNVDNCVLLMRFGRNRGYARVYEAAKLFILADFVNILERKRAEVLDLSVDQILEIIQDDRLRVKQEDLVWDACLSWVAHQPHREQHLLPLMLGCRLALISAQVGVPFPFLPPSSHQFFLVLQ